MTQGISFRGSVPNREDYARQVRMVLERLDAAALADLTNKLVNAGIKPPLTCVYCHRLVETLDEFLTYTHTFYPWSSQVFPNLNANEWRIFSGYVNSGILWFCNENIQNSTPAHNCFSSMMIKYPAFAEALRVHWESTNAR